MISALCAHLLIFQFLFDTMALSQQQVLKSHDTVDDIHFFSCADASNCSLSLSLPLLQEM